jgi:hypothetical protein
MFSDPIAERQAEKFLDSRDGQCAAIWFDAEWLKPDSSLFQVLQ